MKKLLSIISIFTIFSLLASCDPNESTTQNNNISIPERKVMYQTVTFTTKDEFDKYFTISYGHHPQSFNLINQVTIRPKANVTVESLNVTFRWSGEYRHTNLCYGATGGMREQCLQPVRFNFNYSVNSTGTTNFSVDRPSNFSSWVSGSYSQYNFTGRVTVPIDN